MSILSQIAETKKEEIRHLQSEVVQELARSASAAKGFRKALIESLHEPSLIAEIKRASPSRGVIRQDFDAASMASSYKAAGADALSVLTDETYFQGSADHFRAVRAACDLPLLRKDFIIEEVQVFESRAMGADCILLIKSILEESHLLELHACAHSCGMDVLVETHNAAEVEFAAKHEFDLVGVNNRDLSNFSETIGVSHLLSMLPPSTVKVSESSLQSPQDVAQVHGWGARSVLIGTAFCKEHDLEAAVTRVMGWD